jgi:UDP-glucose 4-epimerase
MVTGGAGYIGAHLVIKLLEEGHNVVVLDDLSTGKKSRLSKEVNFIEGSILDEKLLESLLRDFSIDGVFHLAAKKSVSESVDNSELYFNVNTEGTLKVIKSCAKAKVAKIVFSSTAAVYKESNSFENLREDSPIGPLNPYGKSKYFAENYLRETSAIGVRSIIFRYFNVVGSISKEFSEVDAPNLFPVIVKAISTRTAVEIFGLGHDTRDGSCLRDYLHVSDIVDAHIRAIKWLYASEEGQSVTLNLGSGTGYTVLEVIKQFSKLSGTDIPWRIGPERLGDPSSVLCNSTKAKSMLGWTASRDPFQDYWLGQIL